MKPISLYESPELQKVTGETLRPGGFELTDRAILWCRFPAGEKILDAGCGTGATVFRLSFYHHLFAVGVDASLLLLRQEERHGNLRMRVAGQLPQLPFKRASFGGIICECVLSLVTERPETLRRFYDILKPGGYLILTDIYARSNGLNDVQPVPGIQSCINGALPLESIRELVSDAGYIVQLVEDHTAYLRELSVKLIFEFGSLSRFWEAWCSPSAASRACNAMRQLKPGYYLLIAQKEPTASEL
jgi:arsenite methyltransferase